MNDQPDSTADLPIELHLARCICGFVVSARTDDAVRGNAVAHLYRIADDKPVIDRHGFCEFVSSPDPVAAKLLLGAHR